MVFVATEFSFCEWCETFVKSARANAMAESKQRACAKIRVMRGKAGGAATGGFSYWSSSERERYSF
jgi:hypothetical protein